MSDAPIIFAFEADGKDISDNDMQIILTVALFLGAPFCLLLKHHRSGFRDGIKNEVEDQKKKPEFCMGLCTSDLCCCRSYLGNRSNLGCRSGSFLLLFLIGWLRKPTATLSCTLPVRALRSERRYFQNRSLVIRAAKAPKEPMLTNAAACTKVC